MKIPLYSNNIPKEVGIYVMKTDMFQVINNMELVKVKDLTGSGMLHIEIGPYTYPLAFIIGKYPVAKFSDKIEIEVTERVKEAPILDFPEFMAKIEREENRQEGVFRTWD